MRRVLMLSRYVATGLALASLAACLGLSLGTANQLRKIDFLVDDIARIVVALDLPSTLRPLPAGTKLTLSGTTPQFGNRQLEAVLVRADASRVAGSLPAPANGRAYYLFALDEDDKTEMRDIQKWARDLRAAHGSVGGEFTLSATSKFCRMNPVDVSKERFSILIALPGDLQLAPLLSNVRATDIEDQATTPQMPLCETS